MTDLPEEPWEDPPFPEASGMPAHTVAAMKARYDGARARRARFIELLREEPTAQIHVLMAHRDIALTKSAYDNWRHKDPAFGHLVDSIRRSTNTGLTPAWSSGFAEYRRHFFGMDSPWFHLEIVDALENGEPGSVTLILIPPEHGKTTLLTDFQCYVLARDPSVRITYGSEKQAHGVKVGNRLRDRMARFGTAREWVKRFGPFEPDGGGTGQAWGAKFFDVRKKSNFDDQEYSWQAIGFGAAIAGTRCDLLIADDMQSLGSLGQTEKMVATFRQDWLSRPGSLGRTVIIGTRVGDADIYDSLMNEVSEITGRPLVSRTIKYPAVRTDPDTGEPIYLWPERYTPENYARMRDVVGESAWARNYQQAPRDAGDDTFSDEIVAKMDNPLRAYTMPIPADVKELAVTLDPAVGGHNAFTVQGWAKDRMYVLDTCGDWGFTSYDQIWTRMAELCDLWSHRLSERSDDHDPRRIPITTFVVEDKAFQHGLLRDPGLLELQARYGFDIVPHQTGNDKNDDVIGVTGMVRSARLGEIVLPAATDAVTKERIDPLRAELKRWRPRKKGTRLKQDKVMALWFGWLTWRKRRYNLLEPVGDETGPTGSALPWRPMRPVHIIGVPQAGSPFRALVTGRR